MFTTSRQQEISILRNRLMSSTFDENKSWDAYISNFTSVVVEVAAFDQSFSEEEKVAKLIRSFLFSPESLALVYSMTSMSFNK